MLHPLDACVYCSKPCEPGEGSLCPNCKDAVENHTENNAVVVEAFAKAGLEGFAHLLERHGEFAAWLKERYPDGREPAISQDFVQPEEAHE